MVTKAIITKRITATCVVATGIAILWGLGIYWIHGLWQSLTPGSAYQWEDFLVAADGTPVLATWTSSPTGGGQHLLCHRTLDGKNWHEETDFLATGYFNAPHEPAGIVETPLRWNEGYGRVVSATDGKYPPTHWYFVRDDEQSGNAYAAGFDGFSKMPIGYLGRNGFGTTKPLPNEQFHGPKTGLYESFFWLILSDQTFEHKRLASNDELSDESPGQWTAFLIATDHLWEIDLRKRSVRAVADFKDAS